MDIDLTIWTVRKFRKFCELFTLLCTSIFCNGFRIMLQGIFHSGLLLLMLYMYWLGGRLQGTRFQCEWKITPRNLHPQVWGLATRVWPTAYHAENCAPTRVSAIHGPIYRVVSTHSSICFAGCIHKLVPLYVSSCSPIMAKRRGVCVYVAWRVTPPIVVSAYAGTIHSQLDRLRGLH